jgi:hypothetical protein
MLLFFGDHPTRVIFEQHGMVNNQVEQLSVKRQALLLSFQPETRNAFTISALTKFVELIQRAQPEVITVEVKS